MDNIEIIKNKAVTMSYKEACNEVSKNVIRPILNHILNLQPRSAWNKGVREYATEILRDLDLDILTEGVFDDDFDGWNFYDTLSRDSDIAWRLCTPSELAHFRNHEGEFSSGRHEALIKMQIRALYQAAKLIESVRNELGLTWDSLLVRNEIVYQENNEEFEREHKNDPYRYIYCIE